MDELLPEIFAAIREVCLRKLRKRPFDVQLMGGIVMHRGMIAEMKTGEGKTIAIAFPSILNGFTGNGVHVISVNEYLTKRDYEFLKPVYEAFNLSVGCVNDESCGDNKVEFDCDITYCTNNKIAFTYLTDNMVLSLSQKQIRRKLYFAIVDEIDRILIDEARTPLIISDMGEKSTHSYSQIYDIFKKLQKKVKFEAGVHYTEDIKNRNAYLTSLGFKILEEEIQKEGLIEGSLFDDNNLGIYHLIVNITKAIWGMKNNKDYVVKKDEVQIICEFTGRLMPSRRFSDGLHQALEAVNEVSVKEENVTKAIISHTNFFRLYKKLAGASGTAKPEENEFQDIYNLKIIEIPPNKPCIRKDDKLVNIYFSKADMYEDVIEESKRKT